MTLALVAIRVCSVLLCTLSAVVQVTAESDTFPYGAEQQQRAEREYSEMLGRVQKEDVTVDFRAFRVAGVSGPLARVLVGVAGGQSASALEFSDHQRFTMQLGQANFEGALASASRTLERNYASLLGHFDAMVACESLHKTDEKAQHERLLTALLDSIQASGDGKTPETAWFVVTIPEEYVFLSRVVGATPKWEPTDRWDTRLPGVSQARTFVTQNGHAYERVEVIDPKTNENESFWFNVDMVAGPSPSSMQLELQPVELLAGRLIVRLPREARARGRHATVILTGQVAAESRIVVTYGSQTMVFIAAETFSRSDSNFESAMRRKISSIAATVERLKLPTPLQAIAYWPRTPLDTAEGALLMGVFVMRGDGTVEDLRFYLDATASLELGAAWEGLARRIAASLLDGQPSVPTSMRQNPRP